MLKKNKIKLKKNREQHMADSLRILQSFKPASRKTQTKHMKYGFTAEFLKLCLALESTQGSVETQMFGSTLRI